MTKKCTANTSRCSKMNECCYSNLLELLTFTLDILNTNEIHYIAESGTALGSIRENGFISGDTDIDISMTRKEYNKLVKCFKEIKSKYHVQTEMPTHNLTRIYFSKSNTLHIDIWVWDKLDPDKYSLKYMNRLYYMNRKYIDKFTVGKFETLDINIPLDSEEYCELKYGADWKIPCDKDGTLPFKKLLK